MLVLYYFLLSNPVWMVNAALDLILRYCLSVVLCGAFTYLGWLYDNKFLNFFLLPYCYDLRYLPQSSDIFLEAAIIYSFFPWLFSSLYSFTVKKRWKVQLLFDVLTVWFAQLSFCCWKNFVLTKKNELIQTYSPM